MHPAAALLKALGSGIHVVDADIPDPAWPHAHPPRVLRQVEQAADRQIARREQRIGHPRLRCVARAPAHDIDVEGSGGRAVAGHQLVPDEATVRVGHIVVLPPRVQCRPERIFIWEGFSMEYVGKTTSAAYETAT